MRNLQTLRGLVIAVVLAVAGLAYPAGAEPPPQKWALLVGVDRYDSDQISPLKCAAADAHALEAALVEVGGFPKNHIIVMTSDGTPADRPSAENILDRLAGFRSACKPGDEFVFFFSGHGMEEDGESYLLTCNARLGSNASLKKSCLAVKEVQAALAEVKATRILQLVDACRNDPRAGRSAADNHMSRGFSRDLVLKAHGSSPSEARVTLFSCKVGQRSYEGYKNHGYFTYFLVAGMRGEAASNGVVTLPGLVAYLEKEVGDTVRLYEAGKEQTPYADVSGSGTMTWELSHPGKSASASRPADPPAAVSVKPPPVSAPPPQKPAADPTTTPSAPPPEKPAADPTHSSVVASAQAFPKARPPAQEPAVDPTPPAQKSTPVAVTSGSGTSFPTNPVEVNELVRYVEPGVFRLGVPGTWVKSPTSPTSSALERAWTDKTGYCYLFVGVIDMSGANGLDSMALKDVLTAGVAIDAWKKRPQFQYNAEVTAFGAVCTWTRQISDTDSRLLVGRGSIQKNGDRLVLLTLSVPAMYSSSLPVWFERIRHTLQIDRR